MFRIIASILLSLFISSLPAMADGNSRDAFQLYKEMFNPNLSDGTSISLQKDIADLVFRDPRNLSLTTSRVIEFTERIERLDINNLLLKHKVEARSLNAYLDLIAGRLVGLGLELEEGGKRFLKKQESIRARLIGTVLAATMSYLAVKHLSIPYSVESNARRIGHFAFYTTAPIAFFYPPAALLDKFLITPGLDRTVLINQFLKKLDRASRDNVLKLKGTQADTLVNELE